MNKNEVSAQLIGAAFSRFEADRQQALSTINLYLLNPTPGAFPNIVNDIYDNIKKLVEADSALVIMQKYFVDNKDNKEIITG